jgi:hypothetical protein
MVDAGIASLIVAFSSGITLASSTGLEKPRIRKNLSRLGCNCNAACDPYSNF